MMAPPRERLAIGDRQTAQGVRVRRAGHDRKHAAGAVAGDRQDAGARAHDRDAVGGVGQVEGAECRGERDRLGRAALKTVGSKMIVFGPERPLAGVVLAQARCGPQGAAGQRVGGRGDQVGRADLVGTDVDRCAAVEPRACASPALILGGNGPPGGIRGGSGIDRGARGRPQRAMVSVAPPLLANPADDSPAFTPTMLPRRPFVIPPAEPALSTRLFELTVATLPSMSLMWPDRRCYWRRSCCRAWPSGAASRPPPPPAVRRC